jgi:hypothetical protein
LCILPSITFKFSIRVPNDDGLGTVDYKILI